MIPKATVSKGAATVEAKSSFMIESYKLQWFRSPQSTPTGHCSTINPFCPITVVANAGGRAEFEIFLILKAYGIRNANDVLNSKQKRILRSSQRLYPDSTYNVVVAQWHKKQRLLQLTVTAQRQFIQRNITR